MRLMSPFASLSKAEGERLREELGRQYRMLRSEFAVRMVFVALGYAVCAIYVSPTLMLALYMVELVGELLSQRLLHRHRRPWIRLISHACCRPISSA